jgi:hypothetical protein
MSRRRSPVEAPAETAIPWLGRAIKASRHIDDNYLHRQIRVMTLPCVEILVGDRLQMYLASFFQLREARYLEVD